MVWTIVITEAMAMDPRAEPGDYDEIDDDECVDGSGSVRPEHDFPPAGEGDECRRCGAEAEQ